MNVDEMPDVSAAMERLVAAEAAETPITTEAQVQTDGDTTANPPEQTPAEVATKPDSLSTDTPAAAESKPAESQKTPDQKPNDKSKSSFAKDQERRDTSWKAVNTEKTKIEADKQALAAERAAYQREVQAFEVKKAKATQQYKPEDVEAKAQQNTLQSSQELELAEAWDAKAEKLESEGDVKGSIAAKSKADELRDSSNEKKALAKALTNHAKQLRSMPPDPTLQQLQAKRQHEMKEYTMAAVGQWPEFGKQGSEFQNKVAVHLQEARKNGLDVNEIPSLLYHAARLVAAETAAARVPAMEKELGEARAKVKELEALTAPGGGSSSVQRQSAAKEGPKTDAEEESELRAMAANL